MIKRKTATTVNEPLAEVANTEGFKVGDTVLVSTCWGHYSKSSRTPVEVQATIIDTSYNFYVLEGPELPPENNVPGARRMGPYGAHELRKVNLVKAVKVPCKEPDTAVPSLKRKGFFL